MSAASGRPPQPLDPLPTLKLKLVATTISGALMGMAGAPFPYYIGYLEPGSAFGLSYAVNSIAMPMIGGTTSWVGPLVGALLLGTLQQIATVTISSAVNLLIVGLLLIGFVIDHENAYAHHAPFASATRRALGRRTVNSVKTPGSLSTSSSSDSRRPSAISSRPAPLGVFHSSAPSELSAATKPKEGPIPLT